MPTTSGKVFFIGSDLQPHWCSGTAVQSPYRNIVATAGHCLLDVEAPAGALAKWVFVPGYSEGAAPSGLYVGKQAETHYDFDDIRDHDRDYAFVNVYDGVDFSAPDVLTNAGKLADNVGGQGLEGSLGSAWLIRYASDSRIGYLNGITISVADTDGDGRYDTGVSPYFDGESYTVYRYAAATWTGRIA
ncbi:hypothetical protein [Microbispora sp. CA-102843]|uniref:hypothetical protein n=1 Tax=Microbispora sp. CA-102843 TaxID=3239952 RepID=UPI003D8D4E18